jgi:hypothetical protein
MENKVADVWTAVHFLSGHKIKTNMAYTAMTIKL